MLFYESRGGFKMKKFLLILLVCVFILPQYLYAEKVDFEKAIPLMREFFLLSALNDSKFCSAFNEECGTPQCQITTVNKETKEIVYRENSEPIAKNLASEIKKRGYGSCHHITTYWLSRMLYTKFNIDLGFIILEELKYEEGLHHIAPFVKTEKYIIVHDFVLDIGFYKLADYLTFVKSLFKYKKHYVVYLFPVSEDEEQYNCFH